MVEERIRGLSYNQTIRKTDSKRKDVDKLINSIPVWDRVVRALNSHNKYGSVMSNNNEDIDYEDDKISENNDMKKLLKNNSMSIVNHNRSIPAHSRLSNVSKNTSPNKHFKSSNTDHKNQTTTSAMTQYTPYHLYITDEARFIDTSFIPSKLESHRRNISFEKQTK